MIGRGAEEILKASTFPVGEVVPGPCENSRVTAGTVLAQGLGRGGTAGRARTPGCHAAFPLQVLAPPFVSGDTETQREKEISLEPNSEAGGEPE